MTDNLYNKTMDAYNNLQIDVCAYLKQAEKWKEDGMGKYEVVASLYEHYYEAEKAKEIKTMAAILTAIYIFNLEN